MKAELSKIPAKPGKPARSRRERIADAVCLMAEAFTKPITAITIEAYLAGTADLPIEAVETACATAIVGSKWFPKVFELRQMAGASAGTIEAADRAILCWAGVRHAIGSVGSYETVYFDDPITTAVIRKLGGWPRLCDTPAGESLDTWMQKEFCALYQIVYSQGIDAAEARPLFGLNDVSRSEGGYDAQRPPVRVSIGLPEIDKKLIRGVIQEPAKLVADPGPVREFVKSLDLPEELKLERPARERLSREEILAEMEEARKNPRPVVKDPRIEEAKKQLLARGMISGKKGDKGESGSGSVERSSTGK